MVESGRQMRFGRRSTTILWLISAHILVAFGIGFLLLQVLH